MSWFGGYADETVRRLVRSPEKVRNSTIRHMPKIVVHGDGDATVNVAGSRSMVEKMRELGIEVKYIEVPGGSHSGVVAPNLAAVAEFFNAHRRAARPTSQQ